MLFRHRRRHHHHRGRHRSTMCVRACARTYMHGHGAFTWTISFISKLKMQFISMVRNHHHHRPPLSLVYPTLALRRQFIHIDQAI